ncbi:hypothetical protein ACIA98_19180 [Streptomyces sp. NPDC051366]|uniref:hypothetical protein n=1 Tax=Streptomyces sp. NPDC051366 TaxID=3365652 RepID=UPI0037B6E28D
MATTGGEPMPPHTSECAESERAGAAWSASGSLVPDPQYALALELLGVLDAWYTARIHEQLNRAGSEVDSDRDPLALLRRTQGFYAREARQLRFLSAEDVAAAVDSYSSALKELIIDQP